MSDRKHVDIRAEIIEDLDDLDLDFEGPVEENIADAIMADRIRHVKVIREIECPGPDAQKARIAALEKALCDAAILTYIPT